MTAIRQRWRVLALALVALAVLAVVGILLARGSEEGGGDEAASAGDQPAGLSLTTLRSRPDLRPPAVAVDAAPQASDDGIMLVSPRMENPARDARTHQQGGLGLDGQGRTVWFRRAPDGEPMTDVRVQRYRGEPVLTWWQGAASKLGVGRGEGVIVDRNYRTVATVQAGNDLTLDLHEFLITPRGTALVTIYSRARRDLRPIGGLEDAQVTEGVVQEIDIDSGRVLFEWHSLDHVAPSEAFRPPVPKKPEESFDYFHINSVEELPDGDLLVSARHTSAIYRIDRDTGDVVWRLGGKKSDFAMGPGTRFGIQHDARDLPDGTLQVFDNADEAKGDARQAPSSVKRLRLDERRMRATLEQRFGQPDDMWAESQGNSQPLAGGGVMVGWGSTGAFSRFDGRGRLLFDAHLPAEYDSYRAYLARWEGEPAIPPAIHAEREEAQVTVAASWNGATEVRRWQVLAGPDGDRLRPVGAPARWSGLETTIVRATDQPFVAVAALDARGGRLATSRAVRVNAPPPAR